MDRPLNYIRENRTFQISHTDLSALPVRAAFTKKGSKSVWPNDFQLGLSKQPGNAPTGIANAEENRMGLQRVAENKSYERTVGAEAEEDVGKLIIATPLMEALCRTARFFAGNATKGLEVLDASLSASTHAEEFKGSYPKSVMAHEAL